MIEWSPLIIFHYGHFAGWLALFIGCSVELLTVWFYTRRASPFLPVLRSLAIAITFSLLACHLLFALSPFYIRPTRPLHHIFAFGVAYLVSVAVEWRVLSRQLGAPRARIAQALCLGNFYRYAILYSGFLLWEFGWSYLFRAFTGNA